jgi:hypothetical protein
MMGVLLSLGCREIRIRGGWGGEELATAKTLAQKLEAKT